MPRNYRNQSQDPRMHNHNQNNNFHNEIPNRNPREHNRNRSPDFFNFNNFNMDIREDFDDPFDNFMHGFNFPNFSQLHNQIFGNFQNAFNNMLQIGNGKNENHKDNNNNNFNAMFNMQGCPGTMISKSYCSKIDYRDGKPHQEC